MTANTITSVTVVHVAVECPHPLLIQHSLPGTGECQDVCRFRKFKASLLSLCLLSCVFSSSVRKGRSALLLCHPFRQRQETPC